jgi:hypothetical protein
MHGEKQAHKISAPKSIALKRYKNIKLWREEGKRQP